jgi:hypothetical protein
VRDEHAEGVFMLTGDYTVMPLIFLFLRSSA